MRIKISLSRASSEIAVPGRSGRTGCQLPCGDAAATASQNVENEEVTIPLPESETYRGDAMDRLLRFFAGCHFALPLCRPELFPGVHYDLLRPVL